MRFDCEIDNIRTLKKGMKLTLAIDDKQTMEVMKSIYNFMDMPVTVELFVNEQAQAVRLQEITPNQRKKIYALFADIADYTGNSKENEKENMKTMFVQNTEHAPFSLANCTSRVAGDFIEWMIDFCFEHGIRLSEHPLGSLGDVERYVHITIKHRICAVCGQEGEIHHWDAIGAGRNRKKVDDGGLRKICLCRKHHTECHTIGENSFEDKYHVYGVIYSEM